MAQTEEERLRLELELLELEEEELRLSGDNKELTPAEQFVRSGNPVTKWGQTFNQAFNISDEMLAADARLQNLLRKEGDKLDPKAIAQAERERVAQARSEHPFRTGLAEAGATLPLAVIPGASGATTAARMGNAAKMGAAYGAAAGAGSGETLGQRLGNAGEGAGYGAVTGAGIQGVGEKVAAPLVRQAGRGVKSAVRAITGKAAPTTPVQQRAAKQVADMAQREGIFADLGPGSKDQRIYDLLPSGGSERLRQAATRSPEARRALDVRGEELARGQQERLLSKVDDAIGVNLDDYVAETAAIAAGKKSAGKAYEKFYAQPGISATELQGFLKRPTFRKALKNMLDEADDLGEDGLRDYFIVENGEASLKTGVEVSPQVLDRVKQQLDDLVTGAYKTTREDGPALARRYRTLRNDFREFLDEQYPNVYKTARDEFAGPARRQELMELGSRVLREDSDDIANEVAKMTGDELKAFRVGVVKAIQNETGKVKSGRFGKPGDASERLLGTSNKERIIKAAFGDEETFNKFMQSAVDDSRLMKSFDKANPSTGLETPIADAAKDVAGLGRAVVADTMGGGSGIATATNLFGTFSKAVRSGKVDPALEAEVAKILLSEPKAIMDINDPLARELARRAAMRYAAEQTLRAAPVSGAMGGRLATDRPEAQ